MQLFDCVVIIMFNIIKLKKITKFFFVLFPFELDLLDFCLVDDQQQKLLLCAGNPTRHTKEIDLRCPLNIKDPAKSLMGKSISIKVLLFAFHT